MIKNLGIYLWQQSMQQNKKNILNLMEKNSKAKFLDLGCDDGNWTLSIAKKMDTKDVFGVDYIDKALKKAKAKKITVKKADLNGKLPFNSNFFDIIHANQVIEHLYDTDIFAKEIYRVLKPGGYAVISTENLSAWFNILALTLGFRAFSQDLSSLYQVGNPLSPYNSQEHREGWTHLRIFTYFGIKDFFKTHGFKIEKILTAGYYPLPYPIERIFSKIDPIHGHFITIKIRKKNEK